MGRKIIEKIMEEKNPINQDMLKLFDSKGGTTTVTEVF